MNYLDLWNKIKTSKTFWFGLFAVCLFGGGYSAGRLHKIPTKIEVHTVQDTTVKKQLDESIKVQSDLKQQLSTAQNTIAELKTTKVTHTHTIHRKDGTSVTDTTVSSTSDKTSKTNTESSKTTVTNTTSVDSKKQVETITSHTDTKTITTPLVKDNWYVGLSTQIGLSGFSKPGIEVRRRIIGPFWLGASIDTSFSGRASIGVSF